MPAVHRPRSVRGRVPSRPLPLASACLVVLAAGIAGLLSLVAPARAALNGVAADTLFSNVSGRHLGRTVATAGDVNGDGYSDVLVTGNGTVSLYLGGPSGSLFAPSRLAWSKVNFPYGVQAAGIGDVDGDGYDDIAVAWGFRVRVYYGSATGIDTTRTFDFSPSVSTSDVVSFPVAIAPAGDVNGDGIDDMVVGSAESACGPGNTGVVWVFYGSAGTGLTTGNSTEICASTVSISNFGASVCTAGDVNHDGFADVIVGAPGAPNGAAFVYLGGSGGLSTTAATRLNGTQSNGQFGASVSTAGDVNGDGFADVLVGAPNESFSTLTHDGTAYLFLGQSGTGGVSTTPVWFENGPVAGDNLGASVATAGDINGDGLADFLVGIPNRSDPETGEGQFAVFMGTTTPSGIVSTLFPESNSAGAALGSCVATAGDVNGDGFSDVIVSAPDYITSQPNAGGAFVYLGAADLPNKNVAFTTTFGGIAGSQFGNTLATGDFSGDGTADLAIGQAGPDPGWVTLERGGAIGTASGSFTIATPAAGLGRSLAMNGDLDGDGFADLAIGAVSTSGVDSGAVYVIRGNSGGSLSTVYAVLRAPGAQAGDGFGTSVTWADVNGDGRSDLIVGSPDWTGPHGLKQGRVLVYLSGPSGLHTAQAPSQELDGPAAASQFGASVACAGDFNRDGIEDVVIGAPGYPVPNGPILKLANGGYAGVYLGGANGLATSPVVAASGTGASGKYAGDRMGTCVAAAGDLDGDGYSDVAVTSINADLVTIWYGGPSGAAATTTITGPVGGTEFGITLAPAGDIDGDGFGDLLVGAPLMDGDVASMEGRVFLYRGSAARAFGAPDWYKDGGAANAALGTAIAGGDINNDGFPDVIVGAPQYTGANSQQGYVQTFLGDRGSRYVGIFGYAAGLAHPMVAQTSSGGTSFSAFGGTGRSAVGRLRTRLEVTADRVAYGSDHQVVTGGYTDNGALFSFEAIPVTVDPGRPYAWKARWRSQSPLFPWTPWVPSSPLGSKVYAVLSGPIPLAVGGPASPGALAFASPRPSPFAGPRVELSFALPEAGHASLRLYDLQGRARRTLVDGPLAAGAHALAWDGRDDAGRAVAPGVYFARLEAGGSGATRRIVRVE